MNGLSGSCIQHGLRLAPNPNALQAGIVVLVLKASLDEMSGDTKRCRGKVFMIQWLNSALCEGLCVCVFIGGEH